MKKLKILLTLFCVISFMIPSFFQLQAVETGQYLKNAQTLQMLGLFRGTSNGLELNKVSNRAEAAVMLVRLLGDESLAIEKEGTYSTPFTDVPAWADPYVGYLYSKGLTYGVSSNKYGSDKEITGNQYTTMILRALGYSDAAGLYKWDESLTYANSIGFINQQEYNSLKATANVGLLRDYMAKISYNSLFTNNNDGTSLLISLYEDNAITAESITQARKTDDTLDEFVNQSGEPSLTNTDDEMRAVWITYIELQGLFENKNASSFSDAVKAMMENVKNSGLNTVMVQVRPFGDAIYPSEYFPWSFIINGTEGDNPGFDPFSIIVDQAHQLGLKVEAWINPFRIRSSGSKLSLSNTNIANTWLNDGSNRVIKNNGGIFYNPGNQDVRDYITGGVLEIIQNYPVDGIHFDDYFYPSTGMTYDASDYNEYIKKGGTLSQADWRRDNVNKLVHEVYETIKAYNPYVTFGISPQGSFEANYDQQFIDVKTWLQNPGYVDYICPQLYFGYEHPKYPYAQMIDEWNQLITIDTVKLYVGLAAYKIGQEDTWAGDGKYEWVNSQDILKQMVVDARNESEYGGFYLYRYEYLFDLKGDLKTRMDEEMKALKSLWSDTL